jgi:hypothetical protein
MEKASNKIDSKRIDRPPKSSRFWYFNPAGKLTDGFHVINALQPQEIPISTSFLTCDYFASKLTC